MRKTEHQSALDAGLSPIELLIPLVCSLGVLPWACPCDRDLEQGVHACRGLDNRVYYMLAPEGQYYNYSGCGNTFNCNHPIVRKFILDSLRYWVQEMHVDGFRFDLGAIMTRTHSLWHPPSLLEGCSTADALTPQGDA